MLPDSLLEIYKMSQYEIYNKEYSRAFQCITRLKNADKLKQDPYIQGAIGFLEGTIYLDMSFAGNAEKSLQRSTDLFLQTDQKSMASQSYYQLGVVMESLGGQEQKQLYFFRRSLSLAEQLRDTFRIVCNYDAIGCAYSTMGEFDKAFENTLKAESIMLQNPKKYLVPNVYCNMGEYLLKMKKYTKSYELLTKCLHYHHQTVNPSLIELNNAYRVLGATCLQIGKTAEGLQYLNKALDYCRKNIDGPSFLINPTFETLINQYIKNNDFKEAFKLQNEYATLKDKVSNTNTLLRLQQNQVILEANNNEQANIMLSTALENKKKQNTAILFMSFLLLALFVSLLFLYCSKKTFNEELKKEVKRQTEVLSQKNQELERFAFIASHDLRTPLRNIISFSSLIDKKLHKQQYDEIAQFTGFVRDYANHMNNIITDIMDFSRIEHVALKETALVNMDDIKESVVASLKEKIEEKNAVVKTMGTLPEVKANRTHMVQLMQNLVENALMYNESPQPEIVIGATQKNNEETEIFVKDNGIGIEPQYQNKVFEMFSRLHTLEKYPGTGLGLAICKKIVVQYGGRIWLDSNKNEGTTVHIALPFAS